MTAVFGEYFSMHSGINVTIAVNTGMNGKSPSFVSDGHPVKQGLTLAHVMGQLISAS